MRNERRTDTPRRFPCSIRSDSTRWLRRTSTAAACRAARSASRTVAACCDSGKMRPLRSAMVRTPLLVEPIEQLGVAEPGHRVAEESALPAECVQEFRQRRGVGHVAAAAGGDEQLASERRAAFEEQNAAASLARARGGHHAGRPAADDEEIVVAHLRHAPEKMRVGRAFSIDAPAAQPSARLMDPNEKMDGRRCTFGGVFPREPSIAGRPEPPLSAASRKSDWTCEMPHATGASPLWRFKTLLFVASFRCNPLEGLSRPSKPPASSSISEVLADF